MEAQIGSLNHSRLPRMFHASKEPQKLSRPCSHSWPCNQMNEFLTYFLAGMLGEEMLRKIATRPFGFWVLWLIGFILVSIIFLLFMFSLAFFSFFKVGLQPEESLSSIAYAGLVFFFVTIQPWAGLFFLGMGLLFALSYHWHYRNRLRNQRPGVKSD